jgi:hypothetical protein
LAFDIDRAAVRLDPLEVELRAFEERHGLTPQGALTPGIIEAILEADASGAEFQVEPA